MSVLSVAVLLLLLLVALAVGTGGADDPSYYWGQLAYREVRGLLFFCRVSNSRFAVSGGNQGGKGIAARTV